jgi:hypothetical protein
MQDQRREDVSSANSARYQNSFSDDGAHPEVRLSKDTGAQELARTEKHVPLESLDVDFDKVGFGD